MCCDSHQQSNAASFGRLQEAAVGVGQVSRGGMPPGQGSSPGSEIPVGVSQLLARMSLASQTLYHLSAAVISFRNGSFMFFHSKTVSCLSCFSV